MKKQSINFIRYFLLSSFVFVLLVSSSAAQTVRRAMGPSYAALAAQMENFRNDLGGANNGVGGSYKTGRREINWDDVPDSLAVPNIFPKDYYNTQSPRGVNIASSWLNYVSADSDNPTNTLPRFANFNPTYDTEFKAFSGERVFGGFQDNNVINVQFFIPGTKIPASVKGFGLVFSDVDYGGHARIELFDERGNMLNAYSTNGLPGPYDDSFYFLGVAFNDGKRIGRVRVTMGDYGLYPLINDEVNGVDLVVLDDLIYGEPRAIEYHKNDFDGDGKPEMAVYRPSEGVWYIFNSGSNTVDYVQFGLNGDVPVEGDFDGDRRSDFAVWRPSTGVWYVLNSSDAQYQILQFGVNGDKPVAGDYDGDGKTDFAYWRPADGNYHILRSSDLQEQVTNWGLPGDIPIGASN